MYETIKLLKKRTCYAISIVLSRNHNVHNLHVYVTDLQDCFRLFIRYFLAPVYFITASLSRLIFVIGLDAFFDGRIHYAYTIEINTQRRGFFPFRFDNFCTGSSRISVNVINVVQFNFRSNNRNRGSVWRKQI